MAFKFVPIALGLLHIAYSLPAITLQDLEMADDTMSVGSYIREVRAAAPDDYHKTYENEGDGEIGYSRKKSGGGKKGYQHFDSFHKKAGDHYEFEKQDSYGLENEKQEGAHSQPVAQKVLRHRRQPAEAEEEEEERSSEEQKDDKQKEAVQEGASDGNGGIEASGHDPADYTLPEKYTYGTGDEYNF